MLDIIPIQNDRYNCFQGVIASVASFWDREYDLFFTDSWVFNYNKSNSEMIFGERLNDNYSYNFELLEKYHGLKVIPLDFDEFEEFFNFLKTEILRKHPVAIDMKEYWCPWSPQYKKYDKYPHRLLVIGIDDKGNLKCVDPFFSKQIKTMPISDLRQGYTGSWAFEAVEISKNEINAIDIIDSSLKKMGKPDSFNNINLFAKEMSEDLDFVKEWEEFDQDFYSGVALFWYLKVISSSRYNYSNVLKYLSKEYNIAEILPLSVEMHGIAELWENVRINLIRLSHKNEYVPALKKVSATILKASLREEQLHCKISEVINYLR